MINKTKWILHKKRFDIGYGTTSYLKIVAAVMGVGAIVVSKNLILAFLMMAGYGIFCYIFGWFWIKYGWYTADIEVENLYNKFVNEVRDKLGKIEKFK